MTSILDPSAIRDFAGEILVPSDPSYEDARRVFNAAVDRRPALIARPGSPSGVVAALGHARERGMPVTVRGGGHSPAGFSVGDGALTIDLARMSAVGVDPARRRMRVQGGATWRAIDAATQAHGLAVTGARMPSVGVAGFTLGSGSGWLERKLGLAADSLLSARVVTAAGEQVVASPDERRDLFWALRGGGPGFGIVVELEFALAPIGPEVTGGMLGWPAERATEIMAAYASLIAGAPDDLGGGVALLHAPPAPFIPAALQGQPIVAVLAVWTGPREEAESILRPLRELEPALDAVGPMPYATLQGMFERPAEVQEPTRSHVEGGFLRELPPAALARIAEVAGERRAALGSILLQPLGGAFARVPEEATPLGRRDAGWMWQAGAAWVDAAEDEPNRAWSGAVRRALAPWAHGEAYPNFIPDADPARLRAAYSPAVWERLRAIRAEWDPENVFKAGHAIPLPPRG